MHIKYYIKSLVKKYKYSSKEYIVSIILSEIIYEYLLFQIDFRNSEIVFGS